MTRSAHGYRADEGQYRQERRQQERDLSAREKDMPRGDEGRRRGGALRIVLGLALVLGLAIGAAWLFTPLKGWVLGGVQSSTDVPVGASATVQAGVNEKSGDAMHTITFTGDDGDIIYIPELKKNYTIVGGLHKVEIKDNTFISDMPESSTTEVRLNPVLYASGKKARTLQPVIYTITVQPAPLTVISPEGLRDDAYTSMYMIRLQVDPGSRVSIAGTDVTDMINADNIITHNVQVKPIGDNDYMIEVATFGYKTTRQQVTITRPKMDIPLEISIDTQTGTSTSQVTIKGHTDPAATITVKPACKDLQIAQNGDFSFKITMQRYGSNGIEILATLPGKEPSRIEHSVFYSPNLDEYSRRAWIMNYEELQRNQGAYQQRIYKCTGTVFDTISENPQVFYFNVGTQASPQLVVIEMAQEKKVITFEQGILYDIYADVDGKYEGYVKLNGRFVFAAADEAGE